MSLAADRSNPSSPGFFIAGGTMTRDAASYVSRRADDELFDALSEGQLCYVLTPRQMGKSSLMVRTAARLRANGQTAIVVDLTEIGQNLTVDQWYRGLLLTIGDETGLEDELREAWAGLSGLGPMQRLVRAIVNVMLPLSPGRVTIFIDEIDAVRSLPFPTDEFFAGIRELYNRRADEPTLERLTFCLLGVASPSDLIRDTRTTPFNVGVRISLDDFTSDEAAPLARGLGGTSNESAALLSRILHWTGGHPYLTQRLCGVVAADPVATTSNDVDRHCDRLFLSRSARERDDNLVFVRDRMLRSESDLAELLELYRRVRTGKFVPDGDANPFVGALRLAGIARVTDGRLVVRNRIYDCVFDEDWIRSSMPDAETRRQRRAFAAGILRTATVALVILGLMTWLVYDARVNRNRADEQRMIAERERALNARLLYVAHINLAYQALDRRDYSRIAQIIEDEEASGAIGEARGFEFSYLRRLIGADRLTVPVGEVVWKLRSSRDGSVIGARCGENEVRVFDARTGKLLYTVGSPFERALDFAFTNDSRELVVLQRDRRIRRYNALNGASLGSKLEAGGELAFGRLSDGAEFVFTPVNDNAVIAERLDTGVRQTLAASKLGRLVGLVPSPDGTSLLTGHARDDGHSVTLWSLSSGQVIRQLPAAQGQIRDAVWSEDNSRVATGSASGDVVVVDARSGNRVAAFHTFGIVTLAFSHSGTLIAVSTTGGTVELWNIESGARVAEYIGHTEPTQSLAFSADDSTLVSAGTDRTMKFWNTRSEVTASDVLEGHRDSVYSLAFSPDGAMLASASFDGTVLLWDPETNRNVGILRGHKGYVRSVAFSPDGRLAVTGGDDFSVRIWDVVSQAQLRRLDGHVDQVFSVAWSPDGAVIASASFDGTVRIWDARSGNLIRTLGEYEGTVECVAFSPDGSLVAAGGESRTVRFWRVDTGELVSVLEGHSDWVNSLAFSPSGKQLASVGSFSDVTVRVWNLESKQPEFVLKGFGGYSGITQRSMVTGSGRANCVRFTPDGLRLALGTADRTVKLFDVISGQEMCTFSTGQVTQIYTLAFSPNGKIMATGSEDGTIRLFRGE